MQLTYELYFIFGEHPLLIACAAKLMQKTSEAFYLFPPKFLAVLLIKITTRMLGEF